MNKKELKGWLEQNAFHEDGTLKATFARLSSQDEDLMKVLRSCSKGSTYSELVFNLFKERTYCEVCGKATAFRSYSEGYQRFCGKKCRSMATARKAKQTNIERYGEDYGKKRTEKAKALVKEKYGVDNPFALSKRKGKPNPQKAKATNLKKYGVDHPSKADVVKNKTRQTNIKRYGVPCPLHDEGIQKKVRETTRKRYGTEFSSQNSQIKEKIKESKRVEMYRRLLHSDRLKDRVEPLFDIDEYIGRKKAYPFRCTTCGSSFNSDLINGKIPRCPVCFDSDSRSRNPKEDEIARFILSVDPEAQLILNDRELIAPKELDIYIPNRNLAIEFNELWWHSEAMGRGKDYHLGKTLACREKGVRLLHIFEDEWHEKRPIVKSIIASSIGVPKTRIYARNTIAQTDVDVEEFMNDNHLQGHSRYSKSVVLWYKGEIVAAMTFRKPRYSKEADFELLRYASKLDMSIVGGFSKLLSHFRRYNKGSIVSYSEMRMFTGDVYRTNGFIEHTPTPPGYWYSKNMTEREHRLNYQKHKIKDADPNLTEWQNMQLKGYYRIWDCGNWKFVLP